MKEMDKIRREIISKFANAGIIVKEGVPHLQRDNASLIIPDKNDTRQILK